MKVTQFCYFSFVKMFALFVFIQNVFNKPKGTNSSALPLSQGQVSPASRSAVSAGGDNTPALSPSSISGSVTAGLQSPVAQSQQVASTPAVVKLKCQHCNHLFATKPELLFYKVKRDREGDWLHTYPIEEAFLSFHLWQSLNLLWNEKERIS